MSKAQQFAAVLKARKGMGQSAGAVPADEVSRPTPCARVAAPSALARAQAELKQATARAEKAEAALAADPERTKALNEKVCRLNQEIACLKAVGERTARRLKEATRQSRRAAQRAKKTE